MRIGELAQATGVATSALRFYEGAGLLPPTRRTPAGYRDYDDGAVARVGFVRRAQAAGLTLAQVAQVLEVRDGGQAPCEHVTGLLTARVEDIDRQLEELRSLRETVASLRDQAVRADPATCPPSEVCGFV